MPKKYDLKPFREVTDLLNDVEIDDAFKKEQMFNRLKFKMETGAIQTNYTKKDDIYMRKNKLKSVAVTALAVVCVGGVFSTTSYAHEMLDSILARFQVGNMQITQYKELPNVEVKSTDVQQRVQRETPKNMTVKEARIAMGVDFPTPTWMSDYKFVNCVAQGDHMVEVQYQKDGDFISLLISKGVENGISTQDEVKKETIEGTTVYFANGIVIWEHAGFTYEMYQMAKEDFDTQALGKIISSLSTKNN